MGKQYEKKITWVIKDFSSLKSETICSDQFVIGGCKWFLKVYPKGNNVDNHLSLFLRVADNKSLPSGWRRHAGYLLTVVNQRSEKLSEKLEIQHWFDEKSTSFGTTAMCSLNELHAKDGGFLVNGELRIVAEMEVLEVIGELDVTDETSTTMETIDVNGFQLLPSQVESVRRILERHPDIASEFRPKKPSLRTAYMSLLLSLIETMCQLPHELSKDDLSEAYIGLRSMKDAGFKLDWLENKLDEMSEKKEKEIAGETRMQQIENELKDLKRKSSDLEAKLEKEKAEVSAAKAPFSFDNII